jgi:hypothetical protein
LDCGYSWPVHAQSISLQIFLLLGGPTMTNRTLTAVILGIVWFCTVLGAQSRQPDAFPHGQGQLEVVVVDEENKPLAGALVALPGHRCTTAAEGKCKFKVLSGRYPLLISKDRYRGRRVNAGVRPGEVTTTRVELQKLPSAPAPRK